MGNSTKKWFFTIKRLILILIVLGLVGYILYYLRIFNPHDFGEVDETVIKYDHNIDIERNTIVEKEKNFYWRIKPYMDSIKDKIHILYMKSGKSFLLATSEYLWTVFDNHCKKDNIKPKKIDCTWSVVKRQKNLSDLWIEKTKKDIIEESIAPEMYNFFHNNTEYLSGLNKILENTVIPTQIKDYDLYELVFNYTLEWELLELSNALLSVSIYACEIWDYDSCFKYLYFSNQIWNKFLKESSSFLVYDVGLEIKNTTLKVIEVILSNYSLPERYQKQLKANLENDNYNQQFDNIIIKIYLFQKWINISDALDNGSIDVNGVYPFFDIYDTDYLYKRLYLSFLENHKQEKTFLEFPALDFFNVYLFRKNFIWNKMVLETRNEIIDSYDIVQRNIILRDYVLTKLSE